MSKQPLSTQFQFVLTTQETLKNLDELKMVNYQRFLKTIQIGKKVQELSKSNSFKQLQQICIKNMFQIPFLKLQIEDAFISAFNLRNEEIIKYYLQNGFDIQAALQDSVISLAYSLQYLFNPNEAPIQLLKLILQYGANPRYAEERESNTAIHIASQAGNLQFIKLLVQYGADINAVNDNKQTPLGAATRKKKSNVIEYFKAKGASMYWNS